MKKFLKKFLAFLFVALTVFVLVGCKKPTPTPEPAKDPVLTLVNEALKDGVKVKVGDEFDVKATVTEGATLVYESSDATVVKIEGEKASALKEGSATITISVKDYPQIKVSFGVTVEPKEIIPEVKLVTSVKLSGNAEMKVGAEQTLKVEVAPADADNKEVTFASSDSSVATVDANGKVKALKAGTVTITATAKDASGKKAEFAIKVVAEAKPVDPTDLIAVIDGKEYESNSTVQVFDSEKLTIKWKYTPSENVNKGVDVSVSNERYATAVEIDDDTCEITALEVGKTLLTAMPTYGDITYLLVIDVVEKHFDPESITITSKTGSNEVQARLDLQLLAAVNPEKANQEVKWASSDPTIAKVNDKGLVIGVKEGTVTITATSTEKEEVVGTFELKVTPAAEFDRTAIYVNPEWITATGKVTVDGKELTIGENAQYSLATAIKAADEGSKIYLLPGDHEDNVEVDKSLYFIGLGEGVNVKGSILFVASCDGFGFENIFFTASGAIRSYSANGAINPDLTFKNFTMKNCTMEKAACGDDATVHFYSPSENHVFEGCKFNMNTYRGLRWEAPINNLTVKDCEFTTTGSMYDYVRAMDIASGEVLVEGCTFGFNNQTTIQIRFTKENSTYTFKDNYFKDAKSSYIDVREFNGDKEVGNVVINVLGNTFEGGMADSWGCIRIRGRINGVEETLAPSKITLNMHYNKFIDIDPALADDAAPYLVQNANAANLHVKGWMHVEDNFFKLNGTVVTTPGATWFQENEAELPTWFATEDELAAAYAKWLQGADLYVDAALEAEDETHFKTLAGALAVAQDGMLISVKAGEYTENIECAKNVSLVADGEVVINGFVKFTAALKDVKFSGLTIKTPASPATNDGAFQVDGTVENVVFEKLTFLSDANRGFHFSENAKDVTIKGCTFTSPNLGNTDWVRFYKQATGLILVKDCVFNANQEFGVYITVPATDLNAKVLDSVFKGLDKASVDFREPAAGATNIRFTINGNSFEGKNEWHVIRLRNAGLTEAGSIFADVHFNKFYNFTVSDCLVQSAGTPSTLTDWMNGNFNYFVVGEGEAAVVTTEVPEGWVAGQSGSPLGWFATEADLDKAYAEFVATGKYPSLVDPEAVCYIKAPEGQEPKEYKTVAEALEAAEEGATIVLKEGLLEESFVISKPITLTGEEGAIVASKIYFTCKDVTITGLEFTGEARVAFYGQGDISGFVFEGNDVYDIAGSGVAWKSARYGSGVTSAAGINGIPGFLCLAGSWSWVKNSKINNNTFEDINDGAILIVCVDGVEIKDNLFDGIALDAIRFDYANNSGNLVVENNEFYDVDYSGVFIQSIGGGAIDASIQYNYFKNVGASEAELTDGSGKLGTALHVGVVSTYVHQEAADFVLAFNYNVCVNSGNLTIRPNVTNSATFAKKVDVTVEYNAFINEEGSAAPISRSLAASDTEATNAKVGKFNKNFYGTDYNTKYTPVAAQFQNPESLDEVTYGSLAELSGAAEGKLPVNAMLVDPEVATEGNNVYKTIAAALAAAKDGDIIYVKAGTYADELVIEKKVALIGPNSELAGTDETRAAEADITKLVTVKADGAGLIGLKFSGEACIKVAADDVIIANSVLTADPANFSTCNGNNRKAAIVDFEKAIKNLMVIDNKFYVACGEKSSHLTECIALTNVTNLMVMGNLFESNATNSANDSGECICIYTLKGSFAFTDNKMVWPSDQYDIYTGYVTTDADVLVMDNVFTGASDTLPTVTLTFAKVAAGRTVSVIHNQFLNFAPSTFYNPGCEAGSTFISMFNFFDAKQPYKFQQAGSATVVTNYNCYLGAMHSANVYGGTTGDKADEKTFASLEELEKAYELYVETGEVVKYVAEIEGKGQFESLAAAYEAAAAGDTIVLYAGEFDEELVIEKSITIVGPNKGISGLDEDDRLDEAVFTKAITVKADLVTIDGCSFTSGTVQLAGNSFKLLNCYCAGGKFGGSQGYVNFAGDAGGLYVDSCNFEVTDSRIIRAVEGKCLGATIVNSYFNQEGTAECDLIRFNYSNGPVLIMNNQFGTCGQTGIFLGSKEVNADVSIINNEFNGSSASGTYVLSFRNIKAGKIEVLFNTFSELTCTRPIDLRPASGYAETFVVNYNKFNAPAAEKNQIYVSNYGTKDKTDGTQLIAANCNYNYFAQAPVAGTNVMTNIAIEGTFETAEALDAAIAAPKAAYEKGLKYGTAEKPLTVAQAIALAKEECPQKDNVTAELVYVKGFISKVPTDKGNYVQNVYLVDALGDKVSFLAYTVSETAEIVDPYINDFVVVKGYIKNYNGTLEMATTNNVNVEFVAIKRGTSTIAVDANSSADATVTLAATTGTNGTEFTFTVAVAEGAVLDAVKVNGKAVEATEGTYKAVVTGDVLVLVETHKQGEALPELAATVEMTEANFTQAEDSDVFAAQDLTVANFKDASSTALGHYKAPARFYKGSKVTVTYKEAFKKLVFNCNSESYATELAKATVEGATLVASGKVVTITFAEAVRTVDISMPAQVRVDSVEAYVVKAAPEVKKANLVMDFEELTVQTDYVNANWKVSKYTDKWVDITSVMMRVREKNGSKVVNISGGWNTSYKYAFSTGESLGLANSFSIDLGNYWSKAVAGKVKVALQKADGSLIYVLGDANNFADMAVTEALNTYSKTFEDAEIVGFYIVFNTPTGTDGNGTYLYMDNIKLEYK